MTRLVLGGEGLAQLRIGSSPLVELSCALRLACDPRGGDGALEPWWRAARAALARRPLPLAQALHEPGRYVPDFLASQPQPSPSLARDLGELASLAPAEVRRQVRFAYAGDPPRDAAALVREPRAALARLCAELAWFARATSQGRFARLWSLGSAESWERARLLATAGPEGALAGLAPRIALRGSTLVVEDGRDDGVEPVREPGRAGLTLVPTVFAGDRLLVVRDPLAPAGIAFAPAGREAAGEGRAPRDPLAALAGPARARLLRALATPRTSGEVAGHLGVAPSTASEQLRALWEAGLVSSTRRGRTVVYTLDERGRALLALLHAR